jgi:hypothetical protein
MNMLFDIGLAQQLAGADHGTRRLAALQVHTLSAQDRQWLLAHLSAEQRSTLAPLLLELQELEISSEDAAVLLRARTGSSAAAAQAVEITTGLRGASAQAVWQLLRDEPRSLVEQVLMAADWPWADDVRARLAASRTTEPQWFHKEPAPALQAALVSALEQRVQSVAVPDESPLRPARPWWKKWWRLRITRTSQ